MTSLLKPILAVSLMLGGAQVVYAQAAAPAAAPATAASGPIVAGLAVTNVDLVRANSSAFRNAQQQRPTTAYYKALFDQATARATAIQAQLKPLADKFDADRRLPNANQTTLQQQYNQIQQIQQSGQDEINRILAPVELSQAYVLEQINDKIDAAIQTAMSKKRISLLLSNQVVVGANNAYNLNQSILEELNALLPVAQITPPPGWEPREIREQRAAQAAQAAQSGAAPAARPATPTPPARPAAPGGR